MRSGGDGQTVVRFRWTTPASVRAAVTAAPAKATSAAIPAMRPMVDQAKLDSIVAGAAGYVLKQVRGNDLVESIRSVAAGHSLLDPSLTTKVLERLRRGPVQDERTASLTDQEHRILDLLAEGMTNRQIADHMHLAEKTVKNYVSNLLMKMGMARRTEAAVYAARLANRRPGRN